MSANFTPSRGAYTELKPFRFWCQKVLPLVYDDSLSYYELLCKVVDYLNKTMEDVETLEGDVTSMYTAYEQLQSYVNNYFDQNFPQLVSDKLDEMAEDGTLTALITPVVTDTIDEQLPGEVAEKIGDTVAGQIGPVVAGQIGGTVSNQIGPVVANQIGPVVADWLEDNISATTPAVDRTLSILNAAADAAFTGGRLDNLDDAVGYEHISDTGAIITTAEPYAFNYNYINYNAAFSDNQSHTYKMLVIPVTTGDKYRINAHKISIADVTADHFAVTYAFCAKYVGDPDTDVPYYLPTTYNTDAVVDDIVMVPEITIPTGQYYDETTGYLVVITADIQDPVYKVTDGFASESEVNALKDDLNNYTDTTFSNLLRDKTPVESWFINSNTGVGETLAGFYSFINIDVSDYVGLPIYPRSNDSAVNNVCRTIVYYQEDGTTRTGGSGNSPNIYNNGLNVPPNTKYMSLTFRTQATEVYAGTTPTETVNYALNKQVAVDYSQIKNANPITNQKRMPVITFEFDDGNAKDADIVNIFKAKDLTCGFALIGSGAHTAWLGYQADGFEILSHSTDANGMNDASVDSSVIEAKLKNSLLALEREGFNVKGFVTPSSTMNAKFKPLLRKYYQFATTEYLGEYTGTQTPYRKPVNGIYNGFRVSLQTTTPANQIAAVDACIENYGCLTFYGHSWALDGNDYLTTANLNTLLDYIKTKVANGDCLIGNPSDMVTSYFNVRNDDVSDGWIPLTSSEVSLDSRFAVNYWTMFYNPKLKILYFSIRINPTEDVTGQIKLITFPSYVVVEGNPLIQNESGRNCIIYNGGILLQGSNTWAANTNYRFSLFAKIK